MQILSEWWLLRRWLTTFPETLPLSFPLTVEKTEGPDFILRNLEGAEYLLEVTQASHPVDQHAMAKAPRSGMYTMSEFGGRGAKGFEENLPERLIVSDIIRAIRRKRNLADMIRPNLLNLLIYVNSDPGNVVDPETLNGVVGEYHNLIGAAAKSVGDVFVSIRDDFWMVITGNKLRLILR